MALTDQRVKWREIRVSTGAPTPHTATRGCSRACSTWLHGPPDTTRPESEAAHGDDSLPHRLRVNSPVNTGYCSVLRSPQGPKASNDICTVKSYRMRYVLVEGREGRSFFHCFRVRRREQCQLFPVGRSWAALASWGGAERASGEDGRKEVQNFQECDSRSACQRAGAGFNLYTGLEFKTYQ